jgi:hypothetical protein
MKIRFYKGPFGGKVQKVSYMSNRYTLRFPKKMTRAEKHDFLMNQYQMQGYPAHVSQLPIVQADYEVMRDPYGRPWEHPDGSIFFKYVEGSKVEPL